MKEVVAWMMFLGAVGLAYATFGPMPDGYPLFPVVYGLSLMVLWAGALGQGVLAVWWCVGKVWSWRRT